MKLEKWIWIFILIFGFSQSGFAKGHRGHKLRAEAMKQLDLSEDQKVALEKLKANKGSLGKELRAKKKALRKQMHEAMASDASDSDLRKLHEQKLSLKTQMANNRFEKMLAVRKILTPEQRVKFHKFISERRGKMGFGRRGRGPHAMDDDG